MSTTIVNFNPEAPSFARHNRTNGVRQASGRPAQHQGGARRAKASGGNGKAARSSSAANEVNFRIGNSDLSFVINPDVIDVGHPGARTMEAARPTLKPFSVEKCFASLTRETDIKRKLRHAWNLFLTSSKKSTENDTVSDYIAELNEADSFKSIEEFCESWNRLYLEGPKPFSKIVVFKKGIKPVWEDPDNHKGGRFVIRGWNMRETLQMYIVIVCRLMTGRLQADYNDLCGAVLQAKGNDQLWIQIWNKNSSDIEQINRVKTFLNRLTARTVAYQVHDRTRKIKKPNNSTNEDVNTNDVNAQIDTNSTSQEPLPGKARQEVVDDYVSNFIDAEL